MKAKVVLAAAALVFAAARVAVSDDRARGSAERFTLADQIVLSGRDASGELRLARDRVAVAADAHVADSEGVGILFLMPGAAYRQFKSVHWHGIPNVMLAGTEFVLRGRMRWPLLTDKLYVPAPKEDEFTGNFTIPEGQERMAKSPAGLLWEQVSWNWPPDRTCWTFDSDPTYPLVFKASPRGYVLLCGRGRIASIASPGKEFAVGTDDNVDTWLPRLRSEDQLDREGAAQALGWLAKTQTETDTAVPALAAALRDDAMEVRRNAAEALGRIGDARGSDPLTALLIREKDDWVRDVAEESIGLIHVKSAAAKLPDVAALTTLTEGLKHKWPLVRKTAAELLARSGAPAVEPLIASLKDDDARVRAAAATSLGAIGDARAIDPLKQSLSEETDETAKKAIERALEQVEG